MIKTLYYAAAIFVCIALSGCGTTANSSTGSKQTTLPPVSAPETSPTPEVGVMHYSIDCYRGYDTHNTVSYSDFRAAWEAPYAMCDVDRVTGTPSANDEAAAKVAAKADPYADLELLYAICGRSDFASLADGVSAKNASVFKAALMVCPDHPKVADLKRATKSGEAEAAAAKAIEADASNGKFVKPGKYLVGEDMQPGQWQSQGSQVRNCYWEISDRQGEILDNALISIAPQFEIYVPASAAGFTADNCSFRWVGE